MQWMKKIMLITGLMLVPLSHAMAVPVTFNYEGLAFNSINDPDNLLAGYDKITASITFDQAYEDDSALVPNILSYTISGNGIGQLTQLIRPWITIPFFIFKARISTPGTSICLHQ